MKGYERLLPAIATLLLALSIAAYAQAGNNPNFDANKGFLWLTAHCQQGSCQDDIVTTAFYTLALRDSGALDYAQQGVDFIKSKEDTSQHCWPSGSCKIKETAFAMWVLDQYGEDTSASEDYLRNAISADPDLKDSWYLEVITSNNGTCKVSYEGSNGNVEKDVPVSQGTFPSCSQSPVPTGINYDPRDGRGPVRPAADRSPHGPTDAILHRFLLPLTPARPAPAPAAFGASAASEHDFPQPLDGPSA